MTPIAEHTEIKMKNILYLTDFSKPSIIAISFATAIARSYGATIHALHVLTPVIPESCSEAIQADEELAKSEMKQVDSQLAGVAHEISVVEGLEVWPAIEYAIKEDNIDMIVLGTHGRTGATKLLLGSVAEDIFRRSPVPVLTIGPGIRNSFSEGRFQAILFPTDFSHESAVAGSYAISLAKENQARLVMVNVMRKRAAGGDGKDTGAELSAAEVFHQLYETVPKDTELFYPPEFTVKFGHPADGILEAAKQYGAGIIVMGIRDAAKHLAAATHLERPTAHKVVAHAQCPVLTVRG